MSDVASHRGPDGSGAFVSEQDGLALAHRRLAIVDLSDSGAQPMTSSDGRFTLTYNGEIYNVIELRKELSGLGTRFRGHSDTEVLLEALRSWGPRATLARLNGMFAFALWDGVEKRLTLARDRIGIKPLYWGLQDRSFFFASQPKSIIKSPVWRRSINHRALGSYLQLGYVPAPLSIFSDMYKLEPGKMLEVDSALEPTIESFWSIDRAATTGLQARDSGSSLEVLDDLVRDAVGKRMVADVPVGAFLSGGIDSSLVTAVMQEQSKQPVKSFTIAFAEEAFDESSHAKAVAQHLGTDHTELLVSPKDCLDLVPTMQSWYDEPFADSSQIPTYLVSRLAKNQVKVVLSGDGGDEFFCGYERYFVYERVLRMLARVPELPRQLGARAAALAAALLDKTPKKQWSRRMETARLLLDGTVADGYYMLNAHERDPSTLLKQWVAAQERESLPSDLNTMELMQLLDQRQYIHDDVLAKVDRASMAVGLEVRVPLLDHRIMEYAWRFPTTSLVLGGDGKQPLRTLLARRVPRELFERPKMGFGVPIGQWLRGPLNSWAEDMLSDSSLGAHGLFNKARVRKMLDEHRSGARDWTATLWDLVVFQAWHREYLA